MATIALSMHSKQPKRIMISLEKGYIEVYEFPRGQKATIVDAVTGKETVIEKEILKMHFIMKCVIWKKLLEIKMLHI